MAYPEGGLGVIPPTSWNAFEIQKKYIINSKNIHIIVTLNTNNKIKNIKLQCSVVCIHVSFNWKVNKLNELN